MSFFQVQIISKFELFVYYVNDLPQDRVYRVLWERKIMPYERWSRVMMMFLEILMLIPRFHLIFCCRMCLRVPFCTFFHAAFSMFFDYLSVVATIFP